MTSWTGPKHGFMGSHKLERVYDVERIAPAVELFLGKEHTVNLTDWAANPDNIVLVNDAEDMALFERGIRHLYTGHYFFKSRGKKAVESANEFLDTIFNTCYNINMVIGMVPLDHLGARWMTRKLGFTSTGIIDYNSKQYEQFMLTKREFNK